MRTRAKYLSEQNDHVATIEFLNGNAGQSSAKEEKDILQQHVAAVSYKLRAPTCELLAARRNSDVSTERFFLKHVQQERKLALKCAESSVSGRGARIVVPYIW